MNTLSSTAEAGEPAVPPSGSEARDGQDGADRPAGDAGPDGEAAPVSAGGRPAGGVAAGAVAGGAVAGGGVAAPGRFAGPGDPEAPSARHEPPGDEAVKRAFDLLYVRYAGPVGQQCYLLCGDRDLAAKAVAHAFRLAWERWPEIAVDSDPASWVRAAAYEYALSPWHRLRPTSRKPRVRGGTADDQLLLDALLAMPPSYRRSLVLHDALGLTVPDTAAESEATTEATAARITEAHRVLVDRVPRLREVPPEQRGGLLGELLEQLTETQPIRPLPGALARMHSERVSRRQTRAALLLISAVLVSVAVAIVFNG